MVRWRRRVVVLVVALHNMSGALGQPQTLSHGRPAEATDDAGDEEDDADHDEHYHEDGQAGGLTLVLGRTDVDQLVGEVAVDALQAVVAGRAVVDAGRAGLHVGEVVPAGAAVAGEVVRAGVAARDALVALEVRSLVVAGVAAVAGVAVVARAAAGHAGVAGVLGGQVVAVPA